ncbi:hypothetical protein GCM10009677_28740 [Sphaerisporangium rubeum]|uniref:Uncharacterized protein n=1 Tax=Sphaerisporangium rubeum TaxID=321317 RepID=A0A7X0M688_9ACTN|nr:hypothetical protein [Sphaerisporangium rubeum]MBB6472982.1 hypothetical protein [Sphaerisporangium rubeum]
MSVETAENAKKGWRKLLAPSGVLLATVLTAIISWIVTYLATGIERSSTDADPVRVSVETDPMRIGAFSDSAQSLIIPSVRKLNDSPGEGCAKFHEWGLAKNAIDADASRIQIAVQGRAAGETLISNIRVIVLKRSAPVNGLTALCPTAGPVEYRFLTIDLDQPDPSVKYAGKKPFGFKVASGEVETFIVTATAAKGHYLWCLEIDLVAGDKKSTVRVDDDGKPFATTPGTKRTWTWNYKNAWMSPNGKWKFVGGKHSLSEAAS